MSNTFLIADTHFGHAGVCRFMNEDGSKLRPWDDPSHMDEALIANWNAEVKPQDKVYLLGDAVINRRALPTLGRLNGRKILVKGNHDVFRLAEYTHYFDDILGLGILGDYALSHVPIHADSLVERWSGNIHGHLHSKSVVKQNGEIDSRYFCVSVEQTNYRPMHIDDVIRHMRYR